LPSLNINQISYNNVLNQDLLEITSCWLLDHVLIFEFKLMYYYMNSRMLFILEQFKLLNFFFLFA
jgi:hypothetical protein